MSGKDSSASTEALIRETLAVCRRGFVSAGLFSLGINVLMLTVPLYMLQLFDRVLLSRSMETLLLLSVLAGAALLTLAVLDAVRGILFARLGDWVERKLGGYALAGSIATATQQGWFSVQGLRDLASIRGFLSGPGMVPLLDAPWAPVFLAAIFVLHPLLGFLALGGAVALLALVLSAELSTRKPVLQAAGLTIDATDAAEGMVRNAEVIEAMGLLPAVVARWQRRQADALALHRRVARRGIAIGAVSKFLRLALQLAVFGFGAYLTIQNELTAGAMVAAAILMGRALAPLEMAIGGWRQAVGAFGAYQRVRRQLETAPLARPAMSLPVPKGVLTVEALHYAHPGQNKPLLKAVNFAAEPGQALGILGPAGAGKTTLARLLVGVLRPQLGQVRLDGVEVTRLAQRDRAQAIGYLPQDVQLFRGSVRDNIAGFAAATDAEVIAAAELVGAHAMILRLPQAYESEIGERGQGLSGGQRQLIALARAVYVTPRLLVLDEPSASLDREGEAVLITALKRLKDEGMTIVIVAHRGPILQQTDQLLLLRGGQVERIGPTRQILGALLAPVTEGGWPQLAQTDRHG
ncbi:MAG TPA: type I secretion system permease/ATPase [Alphaproteobacteria bacterium]|nr:type I secretion system permease/ATPase [Alphaproteobacteria bacterium]